MTARQCSLLLSNGQSTRSLAEFVAAEVAKSPPEVAWAEPDLTAVVLISPSGRREDFDPLVRGAPNWPSDLPLVEARLFWKDSALHVVSDGACCRWARIEEQAGIETMCHQYDVQTLRDRKRFFGDAVGTSMEGLSAIEYRHNGQLVAWRLVERGT